MRLKTIHLTNYRAHAKLQVAFEPGINAIVGENGSGKTSLLCGICEGLSAAVSGENPLGHSAFKHPEDAYQRVVEYGGRYRFEPQYPVQVKLQCVAFDRDFSWEWSKAGEAGVSTHKGKLPGEVWLDITRQQSAQQQAQALTLPVIAFYRADRHWKTTNTEHMLKALARPSRLDAYKDWRNASVSVDDLQGWVVAKCLERFQVSSETGILFDNIQGDELALVNGALSSALPEVSGLRYDMTQKTILVEWHHGAERIAFAHLSDGQRTLISLVADIARRMCLLNPHLGSQVVAQTPGIILIDELDAHLHPAWQRRITTALASAFPQVQFIVSTHSPQVIGELEAGQILLLRKGKMPEHPDRALGLRSGEVLEEIMGVSAQNEGVQKELRRVHAALDEDDIQLASTLVSSLEQRIGGTPDVQELKAAIDTLQRLQTSCPED